ncbi:hypothetical protein H1R17_01065 [Flavobacterium sp. xlx-214]|uniref:hypothetical protein n=1 Tax=unclassified Flavobacterium TaxID=196869 RepID=UPI0013D3861F|nr:MULTISPECIES: hypothetical protein [unclassified Flavobacterium]MBA5792609.1 hypothetical protein [Flavobacterium sp. xlx-221]QMI83758.1 hypothetical protein H1R17_01065 [Flavobacterium sp. xlx-214]
MFPIKRFYLLGASLTLLVLFSCKPKAAYDKVAYQDIMEHSVQLLAKEEKGKTQGNVANIKQDTLSEVYLKFKPEIDSINTARKEQIQKEKTNKNK